MGCRRLDWYSPQIEEARASDLCLFDSRMPVRRRRKQQRKPELWKPPAAITLNAITFHNSTTGTDHAPVLPKTETITKPTVSTGDILICSFATNAGTTAGTVTGPAGWTLIGSAITSTKVWIAVWVALQSVANLGFTANAAVGAADLSWEVASFTGVDNVTPIDATGTGSSNTGANSISVATFNTVTDKSLELFCIANFNGANTFTQASFNILASSPTNCQMALCYAKAATSPAGATGAFTVNDSAAASGNILCYQQFALRPAAGTFQGDEEEGIRLPIRYNW
jgi:hypothetical protein